MAEVGELRPGYQDTAIPNLKNTRVEAAELWAFVGAKAENATPAGRGDCWTCTAVDADSKLLIAWLVSARNSADLHASMADVAARFGIRVRPSTDWLSCYVAAVEYDFGWKGVDFVRIAEPTVCRGTSQSDSDGIAPPAPRAQ